MKNPSTAASIRKADQTAAGRAARRLLRQPWCISTHRIAHLPSINIHAPLIPYQTRREKGLRSKQRTAARRGCPWTACWWQASSSIRWRHACGGHRLILGFALVGAEHRPINSRHPQTNGMINRFNGRPHQRYPGQGRFRSREVCTRPCRTTLNSIPHICCNAR